VDPDIPGKRVGANNTQLFSWHWPGNDEWIVLIVTSIIEMTIFSILDVAITSLSDPSLQILKLWGSQEDPNEDIGPHTRNVTLIFDNNTAAGWVLSAVKLNNPMLFASCIVGNKPTAHLMPSLLCMLAAASILW